MTRSPQVFRRVGEFGWPVLGLATVVGAWALAAAVLDVPEIILPSPADVLDAFLRVPGYLLDEAMGTLLVIVLGFALAVGAGLVIGVALAASRIVELMFAPLLVAFNAVPKVALAPLLVVWMGFGSQPKVVMALLVCFFPVVLSVAGGLTSTPVELVELARSLRASRAQTFLRFRFPSALPQIFVGLKVAMPLAAVGAVIGEFSAGDEGLGFVIMQSGANSDTALAFAAIALLGVVSVALFYALVLAERTLLPWVRETTSQR
ncbi:ABC transporter permease [Streptomyces sp. NBC_00038]|uniref:ABC transporter permease n=1 Tax=Streptomyces sp. NBC_00038 TaxID=2903615 RepID=UPI00225B28EA|nr:ABC transporter permease [Streptomyces sp. NBC_00038]MCX5558461.1 ABC transporter permease [Streptomyces sp. NBC_00038]